MQRQALDREMIESTRALTEQVRALIRGARSAIEESHELLSAIQAGEAMAWGTSRSPRGRASATERWLGAASGSD
jgi:hypothetical protein